MSAGGKGRMPARDYINGRKIKTNLGAWQSTMWNGNDIPAKYTHECGGRERGLRFGESSDEAFNKAIRGVPTEVKVKNDPVCLAQEDRDMLDGLKSQLDKRNRRFSVFSQMISGNKIWFLYLILTAAFSIGITILVMKNSVNEWAHRAMIAAIDMNDENPIGVYLTCRAEMPEDRKSYKERVRSMEHYAGKILYLESILSEYIGGEFCVKQYESRKTDCIEYAAICHFTGSKEVHVYNIRVKNEEVEEVTRRCKNDKKKKKDDPEFVWIEVKRQA